MIKLLILNCFIHDKNKEGLITMLTYLHKQGKIDNYKFGSLSDIPDYDVIYSPSQPLNTALYPDKKFLFGPHFSVFPDHNQLKHLKSTNSLYLQPSEWALDVWKNMGVEQFLPLRAFPFPVNTDKFQPTLSREKRENTFIYYKRRQPEELKQLQTFLQQQPNLNVRNCRVFDYTQGYAETDYLHYLQNCKFGIILDAHESQGFAIEEALASDVPLLVWNAHTMNQEYKSSYQAIPCTSIPYWDDCCGEYFHHLAELPATFQRFQTKLANRDYNPRQYILENLSIEKCAERLIEMI